MFKKLLPPFLYAICIVAILILGGASEGVLPYGVALVMGLPLAAGGLLLVKRTQRLFSQAGSQIHTFKTPRNFVSHDVFSYSRNPIYLGFLTSLLGIAFVVNGWGGLLPVAAFWAACHFVYIPFEEANAKREFGEEYELYQTRVRRWL